MTCLQSVSPLYQLSYKITRVVFLIIFLFFFLFLYTSPVHAVSFSYKYNQTPPAGLSACAEDCPAPSICWNSERPGVTNCGATCPGGGGDAWTKYENKGCFEDPIFGEEQCNVYYDKLDVVCSTADKCTSTSNNPYLNAGRCDCTVLGIYKTCCTNTSPSYVASDSCVQLSVDTTNPPYEGVCPAGSYWIMCGVSQADCNDVIANGGRCTTGPCGQEACGPIVP